MIPSLIQTFIQTEQHSSNDSSLVSRFQLCLVMALPPPPQYRAALGVTPTQRNRPSVQPGDLISSSSENKLYKKRKNRLIQTGYLVFEI